jgi:hypothetical protein
VLVVLTEKKMTTDKKYYLRSGNVKEKKVGEDLALYVQDDRSIHVLNNTARFIWECLKSPLTFDEILFMMGQVFKESSETLKSDLEEALSLFSDKNLIEIQETHDNPGS